MASERFSLVDNVPSKCIVLHVKLTDSSLKCLESYRNDFFKKNLLGPMKIKLDSNQGVIKVPSIGNNSRNFSFNLSSLPHNDASTECFLESDKKKCFQNVGIIKQKMIVRASEDVYQNTMQKISNTNLEIKKNCTKEIKLKGNSKKTSRHGPSKLLKLMEHKKNNPDDVIKKKITPLPPDIRPPPRQPHKPLKATVKEETVKVKPPMHTKVSIPEPTSDPIIQSVKQESTQVRKSGQFSSQEECIAAREEFEKKYKVLSALNVRIENRLKYFNSLVKKFKETMQKEHLEPIYNEHAFLSNNDDHLNEKKQFNLLHEQLSTLKKNIQEFKPPSN